MTASQIVAAVALSLLLVGEHLAPAFTEQRHDAGRLLRHDLRNLLFGAVNALLISSAFAAALVVSDYWFVLKGFGLLPMLLRGTGLPWWVVAGLGLVLFDCWMYWWHRINHAVPLLWRFHRMHHSDPAMDASSGVRFHPGEILLSGVARLVVVPLLGMPSALLLLYESIALPVVLFQHANIRLPRPLDYGLFKSGVMVTPAMHRVHHSQRREETNSNYSSVLSVWDRLFGTLRVREDLERVDFGLPEFRGGASQTLVGMLRTPIETPDPPPDE